MIPIHILFEQKSVQEGWKFNTTLAAAGAGIASASILPMYKKAVEREIRDNNLNEHNPDHKKQIADIRKKLRIKYFGLASIIGASGGAATGFSLSKLGQLASRKLNSFGEKVLNNLQDFEKNMEAEAKSQGMHGDLTDEQFLKIFGNVTSKK